MYHARNVFLQAADVAVPRDLFASILERIVRPRPLYGHRIGRQSAAASNKAGCRDGGTVTADGHSRAVLRHTDVQGCWMADIFSA